MGLSTQKSFHITFNWFYEFVIGDEKWNLYINHTFKRQWFSSNEAGKPTLKITNQKVMLEYLRSIPIIYRYIFRPFFLVINFDSKKISRTVKKA